MKYLKILKYPILAILAFNYIDYLSMPFKGESTFTVTTIYYASFIAIPLILFKYRLILSRNLLITCMSLICSLFLAEITLRYIVKYPVTYLEKQYGRYQTMYDSDNNRSSDNSNKHLLLYEPKASLTYQTPEFYYPEETANISGLRGNTPNPEKPFLIALGDSFTESHGAPKDSTYPILLEKLIIQTDNNSQVINAGISGSDPFFEFNLLKKLRNEYHFHSVIFMLNTSDINEVMMRGDSARFLTDGSVRFRKAPFWEPAYAVSYLFRLAAHVSGYDYQLMTKETEKAEKLSAIKTIAELFRRSIIPWAHHEKIELYIVLQPMLHEIINNKDEYIAFNRQLMNLDVHYLNMRDSLVNYRHPQELYWKQDGHFNSKGYDMAAKIIFNTFFNPVHVAYPNRTDIWQGNK